MEKLEAQGYQTDLKKICQPRGKAKNSRSSHGISLFFYIHYLLLFLIIFMILITGNFHRIRSALSYGAQKLGDILMLPLENIKHGLEIYFKDTLERNGKGSRADVDVPVSAYGSETSSGNSGDDHLSGLHYGLWVHYYGAIYPIVSNTSESDKVWNNRWPEMVYNAQCDQNIYYGKSIDKSPPSSFDGVRSIIPSKAASVKENRKSRGTGTFIPYPVRLYFCLLVVFVLYS